MIIEDSLCKICSKIDGVNVYRALRMNHFCLLMKRYGEDNTKSIRLLDKARIHISLDNPSERLKRADICEQIQALDPLSSFDWQRRVWTSLVIPVPHRLSANQAGWYQLSN